MYKLAKGAAEKTREEGPLGPNSWPPNRAAEAHLSTPHAALNETADGRYGFSPSICFSGHLQGATLRVCRTSPN